MSTFTIDDNLADRARQLGINISAAARQGVADAVRAALARSDRQAYQQHPERPDPYDIMRKVCSAINYALGC